MSIKEEILPVIESILSIKEKDILQYKKGKTRIDFSEIRLFIGELYSELRLIQQNLDFFDINVDIGFKNSLDAVRGSIQNILNANEDVISNQKAGLIGAFNSTYQAFYKDHFWRFSVWYTLKQSDLKDNAKLKKQLIQSQKNLTKLEKEFENKIEDFDRLKKSYSESTQKDSVSNYVKVFGDESEKNLNLANKFWDRKKYLFLGGFASLIVLINYFSHALLEINDLYLISINIIFSSIFILILIQFFKRHNAYLHLDKINKHKENCLKIFRSLVESSEDDEVKREVLIQSTKIIFETPETGFIKSNVEKSNNFIVENIIDKIK